MEIAAQLNIESELTCATDQFRAEAPLDSNQNPFTSSAPGLRLVRPVQIASGELLRLIGLRTPVVVVLGNAGMGKTVLVSMVARACGDMGLSVRRIERGDLLTHATGNRSDVLLVDEADSMSNAVLQSVLTAGDGHRDRTIVFLCLPSSVSRFNFSGTEAVVLELGALSLLDARLYLTERGNSIDRPNLFELQALDVVIDASRGVPRVLRSIASLAYFNAVVAGASQIAVTHAEAAARMRNELCPTPSAVPHAVAPLNEVAEANQPSEFHAVDLEAGEATTDPVSSPAENEPVVLSQSEFFGRSEATRDGLPLGKATIAVALGIVLLIAGASAFALISTDTPLNRVTEGVSLSPAMAVARPGDVTAPPAASETPPTIIVAPAQSAPASAPASANTSPTPVPTNGQTTRDEHPGAARVIAQSHSVSRLRPAPRQIALPAPTAVGSYTPPLTPPAARVDPVIALESPLPAAGDVAAPQNMPAQLVAVPESASPLAQEPSETPASPAALQQQRPAVAADKVQTQQRGDVARTGPDSSGQKEAPPKADRLPVIIFGYWLR